LSIHLPPIIKTTRCMSDLIKDSCKKAVIKTSAGV
jgi:hypothetical protein